MEQVSTVLLSTTIEPAVIKMSNLLFTGRSPGNSLNGSPRDAAGHLAGGGTHEVLDTEGSASVSGGSTRSLDQGNQTTPLTLRRGRFMGNESKNHHLYLISLHLARTY